MPWLSCPGRRLVDPPTAPVTVAVSLVTYPGSGANASDAIAFTPNSFTITPDNWEEDFSVNVTKREPTGCGGEERGGLCAGSCPCEAPHAAAR